MKEWLEDASLTSGSCFFLIPGVQWGSNGSYIGRHCNKSVLGWDSKALSN